MNDTAQPQSHSSSKPQPAFIYGTAWKEDRTQALVELALKQGFRAIDTANQRKHYHEAAVGRGIQSAISQNLVTRDELFLQTKFTFQRGQDHRLPYDSKASIPEQVRQSFESSLEHLGTDHLDSYVLHGPSQRVGLTVDDWDAWHTMEALHDEGRILVLGISNVTPEQLRSLCLEARVRPRFVQNRCYAVQGWDQQTRAFCRSNGITYQGFSLLTANVEWLNHPTLRGIAARHQRTANQIVFRFALHVDMLPLTGTTDALHMREDLDVFDFQLSADEIRQVELLAIG
ncbi:aldo/keto reductase family protein [Schlesneria paludicola]|uniref:aldo/keto reductase family protein n=1 Tax=Schlesneria paludicola TaxID=360056 RepID=UPI00029B3553|nr:aldo/keto reductase [Schlesneria paludicola]